MTAKFSQEQKRLIGALIGLARAAEGNKNRPTESTDRALLAGMQMIVSNPRVSAVSVQEQVARLHAEKEMLTPRCASCPKQCGRNDDCDLDRWLCDRKDDWTLRAPLLMGLLPLAAYGLCVKEIVYAEACGFLHRAFFFMGRPCDAETLAGLMRELGTIQMALYFPSPTESPPSEAQAP